MGYTASIDDVDVAQPGIDRVRALEQIQGFSFPGVGEPLTVVLVGCSGPKLDRAAPARDLYTSPLFRASRAYAEALGYPWAILSAKCGLLQPLWETEPYDETFRSVVARYCGETTGAERRRLRAWVLNDWAERTAKKLRVRYSSVYKTRYVFLAGEDYRTCVRDLPHAAPLEGLGIGERIAWLKAETAALTVKGVAS